jgi:hypothetical protein
MPYTIVLIFSFVGGLFVFSLYQEDGLRIDACSRSSCLYGRLP